MVWVSFFFFQSSKYMACSRLKSSFSFDASCRVTGMCSLFRRNVLQYDIRLYICLWHLMQHDPNVYQYIKLTCKGRIDTTVSYLVNSKHNSTIVESYFSFQPVLHDWCNKGRGMYYPVCGIMHIKEPLLLIGKSSLCGGSGFPLSLSEWSFTICLTPYNRK